MTAPFGGFGAATAPAPTPEAAPAAAPTTGFGGAPAAAPAAAPTTGFGGAPIETAPAPAAAPSGFNENLGGAPAGTAPSQAPAAAPTTTVHADADATGFGAAVSGDYVKLSDLANKEAMGLHDGGIVVLRPKDIIQVPDQFNPGKMKDKAIFDLVICSTGPKPEMAQRATTFLPDQSDFGGHIIGACRRAISSKQRWIYGQLGYVPSKIGQPGLKLETEPITNDIVKSIAQVMVALDVEEPAFFGGIVDDADSQAAIAGLKQQLGK